MSKPIYLYVCPFFPSPKSWRGGFFLDAVKALMRDGRYDVRVMVGNGGMDYEIDGIKVNGFKRYAIGCSDYFEAMTDRIKVRQFAAKLRKMGISPNDVSVCHVHLLARYAFYAEWMKRENPRCLTLLHHHLTGSGGLGYRQMPWLPFVKEIQYLRLRHSYECVDVHVFCSEACRAGYGKVYQDGFLGKSFELRHLLMFPELFRAMNYRDSKVVYNGIDDRSFYPKSKTESECYRIGCVANFTKQKSQITLIKAFELARGKMPRARLILVGSGAQLSMCKNYVREHNLNEVVEFYTEMDHREMPNFYRSLNLHVMPSYWEAFNCSTIEAWACGVPCLATREISFKEVLNPEDCENWLFPARSDADLARLLLTAYQTHPCRQELNCSLDIDEVTQCFLDWVDRKRLGI